MRITLATYEHATIGFPHVKLRWTVADGKVSASRVVVKDVIDSSWTWHNVSPMPFIDYEVKRFDDYVRNRFANDVSVQG